MCVCVVCATCNTDAAGAGASVPDAWCLVPGAGVDLGLGIDFMLTLQYFLNENKQKMPLQLPFELDLLLESKEAAVRQQQQQQEAQSACY